MANDQLSDDALDLLLADGPPPPAGPPVTFEPRADGRYAVAAVVTPESKPAWDAAVSAGADAPSASMRAAIDRFFADGPGVAFVALTTRLGESVGRLDSARAEADRLKGVWLETTRGGADPSADRVAYRTAADLATDLEAEHGVLAAEFARLRDATRAGLTDALRAEWDRLASTRPAALKAAEDAAERLVGELNKPSIVAAAAEYRARLAELHALGGGADLSKLIRGDGRLDLAVPTPSPSIA